MSLTDSMPLARAIYVTASELKHSNQTSTSKTIHTKVNGSSSKPLSMCQYKPDPQVASSSQPAQQVGGCLIPSYNVGLP
jgi:hypothetical protein